MTLRDPKSLCTRTSPGRNDSGDDVLSQHLLHPPTKMAARAATHLCVLKVALTIVRGWLGHLFLFNPVGVLVHVLIAIPSPDLFANRELFLFELVELFLAALQLPLQLLLHCQEPPLFIHASLVLQLQLPQLDLQFFDLLVVGASYPKLVPCNEPGPCLGVTASDIYLLKPMGK